jgi:hypothetical protein
MVTVCMDLTVAPLAAAPPSSRLARRAGRTQGAASGNPQHLPLACPHFLQSRCGGR